MPSLRLLNANSTMLTDIGLAQLAESQELRGLFVRGTRVTERGVNRFRQALPNCEVSWQDAD